MSRPLLDDDGADRAQPGGAGSHAALAGKFALELCAFAALAYWGATTGPPLLSVALGVGTPLLAVLVWARWAAPRSARRLPGGPRLAVESAVFAAAALGLLLAGRATLAAVLGVLVVLDTWLLHRWGL